MLSVQDTICAVATAPGGSLRGIVRLSGPETHDVLRHCFVPLENVRSPSLISGYFQLDGQDYLLPVDLFFWPHERSYTRQPTAELHTIGSPPLLNAMVRTLCSHGARPAESGEFTLRAFLAGRIDLTQAEAVIGVIGAVGRKSLDASLKQLAGGFSRPLSQLREQLLNVLAHLEAGLDFVEEDISFISQQELSETLAQAKQTIDQLIAQLGERNVAQEFPRVVLMGVPNVGKSSLFNAILEKSKALVANQPGTTRDYLSALVDLHGVTCELIDTAGIEESGPDEVLAQAAQNFTTEQLARADVTILCTDSSRSLLPLEREWLSRSERGGGVTLHVLTKSDQAAVARGDFGGILTSSPTGTGIDELRQAIGAQLASQDLAQASTGTAERCNDSLAMTAASLERAQSLSARRFHEELIAAELRTALCELGKVVGAIYTDDILDRIFSRFCIGK